MAHSNVIVITHGSSVKHDTGLGHPEKAERIDVIMEMLDADLPNLTQVRAEEATDIQILRAHDREYLDELMEKSPKEGLIHLDPDTVMSPATLDAARHAAGGACLGIDMIMNKQADAAFVAMRPPGHHAEVGKAMGFCFFANAYIAARHAQEKYKVGKVAIVDFDVHHGNGTADMIYSHARDDIFYASTHQFPFYPGTGDPAVDDDANGMILDVPLPAGTGSTGFRDAYTNTIFPAVKKFAPELLIISAGFDAHKDDPVGGLHLDEEDFRWVTEGLKAICPQILSVLEGGYDLNALANSVRAHLEALIHS